MTSFQKEYETKAFTHCYDVASVPDGSYLIAGIEDIPNVTTTVPYITKLDCSGEPLWTRKFEEVSGLNNINHEVVAASDDEFYLLSSRGVTGTFDIMVVRLDGNGNVVWSQTYGGQFADLQGGITVLSDGNLAIVGNTRSYGSNTGSFYTDMYALKVNSTTGAVIWSTVLGFTGASSEAFAVVENDVGGIAFTGRTFHSPTVATWAPLVQLDALGNLIDVKFYGLSDRNTIGAGINRSSDGGYLISGSSNILGLDWFDTKQFPFVIKTDANGTLEWGSVIEGTPNASNLGGMAYSPVDDGDTVAVAIETYFYNSVTSDPTKRVLCLLDQSTGALENARQYNVEGGQFPVIEVDFNGGYIMSAFTDENNGTGPSVQWWNGPILNKLDSNFNCGCNETDRTPNTIVHQPTWTVDSTLVFTSMSTGGVALGGVSDSLAVNLPVVETFCEVAQIKSVTASVTTDTCASWNGYFSATVEGSYQSFYWDFGDGTVDSSSLDTTHTYPAAGTYNAELVVQYCDTTIIDSLVVDITSGPGMAGDSSSSICNAIGATFDLNTLLPSGVTPGSWEETTLPASGQFNTGTGVFDASGLTIGTYTFDYIVPGSPPCSDDTLTMTITVTSGPNAGVDGDTAFCEGAATLLDLSSLLDPAADAGGVWSETTVPVSGAFNASTTVLDITSLGAGVYTFVYDVGVAPCTPDQAVITVTIDSVPIVSISGALEYCQGGSTVLDAGPGFASYSWSNGSQGQTTSADVTMSPLSVTVVSANDCSSTSAQVVLIENPLPTPLISGNLSICSGATTTLDAGSGFADYLWSTGDLSQTINADDSMNPISVTVTDANGCEGTSPVVNVLVLPAPTASFSASNVEFCQGMDTIVDIVLSGSPDFYIEYAIDGVAQTPLGPISTGTYPLLVDQNGTYEISVITDAGCSDTLSGTLMTATEIAVPSAPTVAGGGSYCEGASPLTLDASSSGGTLIWYSDPGLLTAVDTNTSITAPTSTGVHSFWVVESNGACMGQATQVDLEIFSVGYLDLPSEVHVCEGDSVYVTPSTSEDTVYWSTGDTTTSGQGLWVSWDDPLWINADITNTCGAISQSIMVIPHSAPAVDAGMDQTILLGASTQLDASVPPGVTVQWVPDRYLDCNDCVSPLSIPGQSQEYVLVVTDSHGCSAADTVWVIVDGEWEIFIPNVFSPNNDGWNDLIEVKGPPFSSFSLKIFNRWGEMMFESESAQEGWDGTWRGQPAGEGVYVYMLRLQSQDGRIVERQGNITLLR